MPKPARGTTFICSPASPLRSARISCQDRQPWIGSRVGLGASAAWNRARWRATRGLSGSSGSCAVIMWRPAVRRRASGWPWPRPRTKIAPARSASTRLKLRQAPASRVASAAAALSADGCSRARSGSSPRLRLPAAGPRLPGRFSTAATMPSRFTPIHVPPPERSRPAMMPGRSGQCPAGGSHARFSISSRLAASTSGQAWAGRIRTTTVHITADDGVGSGHTSQPAMSVNFRTVRRSDGMIVGRDNMSRFASFATKYPASIMRGADLRGYGPDMEGLALMRQLDR